MNYEPIPVELYIPTPNIIRIHSNPYKIDTDVLNIAISGLVECYDSVTDKFWLDDGFLDVGVTKVVYFNYEESYYEYVDGMASHEIPEAFYFTIGLE